MQKLIIATIGLSLSLGVAASAVAQSAMAPPAGGQGDTSATAPNGAPATGPSTSSSQTDPSNNSSGSGPISSSPGSMSSGGQSAGGMPSDNASSGSGSSGNMAAPPAPPANQSYPRCSATVHDECRQRQ